MSPQKWEEIKMMVKNKFEVLDEGVEKSENEFTEIRDFVIFNGPLGKMQLEFITRPKVLDKKTEYSNRIGSGVKIEYIYSKDEKVNIFKIWQWSDQLDNWQEVGLDNFNLGY